MRLAIAFVLLCGCSSGDSPAPNDSTPPPVVACDSITECRADDACQLPNASTKGTCIKKCTYQGDHARESSECPAGSLCIGVTGVTMNAFCYRRCTAASECGVAPTGMTSSCEAVQGVNACVYRTR